MKPRLNDLNNSVREEESKCAEDKASPLSHNLCETRSKDMRMDIDVHL